MQQDSRLALSLQHITGEFPYNRFFPMSNVRKIAGNLEHFAKLLTAKADSDNAAIIDFHLLAKTLRQVANWIYEEHRSWNQFYVKRLTRATIQPSNQPSDKLSAVLQINEKFRRTIAGKRRRTNRRKLQSI